MSIYDIFTFSNMINIWMEHIWNTYFIYGYFIYAHILYFCMGRQGLTCHGSGPRKWCLEAAAMSINFLAIAHQLEWAFHFVPMWRSRRLGKIHSRLASIDFSIIVMPTLRGFVSMVMWRCPLLKRCWLVISLWGRHLLLRFPPCHPNPFKIHLV